jgi:hypothetical protein
MEIAAIALEFMKIIFSWPVVCGIIAMRFMHHFRNDISAFLLRLRQVKLPGGTEVSADRQGDNLRREVAAGEPPSPGNASTDQENFSAERVANIIWEYRYLNFFLVRRTQVILDWLLRCTKSPNVDLYHAMWISTIPEAHERRAVLEALERHSLIEYKEGLIVLTQKGREYHQWRGPLPPVPDSSNSVAPIVEHISESEARSSSPSKDDGQG